jgi:hypothetical protein
MVHFTQGGTLVRTLLLLLLPNDISVCNKMRKSFHQNELAKSEMKLGCHTSSATSSLEKFFDSFPTLDISRLCSGTTKFPDDFVNINADIG